MMRKIHKAIRQNQKSQRSLRIEPLETRQLLAVTLPSIANQTVQAGAPLMLPLHSSGTTNPVSYAVSVNNSIVAANTANNWADHAFLKFHVQDAADGIDGDMVFELFKDLAPKTVDQITGLVNSGFYNGLTFHRVIKDFVIQGGDPVGGGTGGPGFTFDDEFNASLQFTSSGILAMANRGDDTNGSQFFITDGPTRFLDFNFSIFGFLVQGDDIRQQIENVPVHDSGHGEASAPNHSVTITSASIIADAHDGVLRLSAPLGGSGTSIVTVTARDTVTLETSTQQFEAVVQPDTYNDPPFLDAVSPIVTAPAVPVTFNIPATDVEGDPIYYDAIVVTGGTKLGLTVDHGTGRVTVTPAADIQPGAYQIKLFAAAANDSYSGDTQVITVNVVQGHQPPMGMWNEISTVPGVPYIMKVSDFRFSDPGDTPPNSFTRVLITTAPTSGTLSLDGQPVADGTYVPVADIAAGKLTFTSDPAVPHPTFTFQVEDSGSADPAINLDPVPRTITFDTLPVAQDDSYTVNKNTQLDQWVPSATLEINGNDWVAHGNHYLKGNGSNFHVSGGGSTVNITYMDAVDSWFLTFSAGSTLNSQNPLGRGTYIAPAWDYLPQPGQPGISISGNGRAPSRPHGTFTVNEVEFGPSGTVLVFDADFTQYDDNQIWTSPMTGHVHYRAVDNGAISVLQNDSDADGDPLTTILVTEPQHGSLILDREGGFLYTPNVGFTGTDSFQYQANDWLANSNVATVTINAIPFSYAPQGTSGVVNVPASPSYALQVADFGFTDPNDTPADSFTRVKVTTLPATASLTLSGEPVAEGQFVDVADIQAGNLVLSPVTGTPHINFTFQVEDSGSTENGGANLDPTPKTITFNVPPAAQDDSYTVNESETLDERLIGSRLQMVSESGDPIGFGQTYDYGEVDYIYSVSRDVHNGIQIYVGQIMQTGPGDLQLVRLGPQLYFAAADGGVLTPGTYTDTVRSPSTDPSKPSMYVTVSPFSILPTRYSFTGQFTVNQVEYGPSGEVLGFDATFEQHASYNGGLIPPGYNPAALTGRIQYRVPLPQHVGVLQNDEDADGDVLSAIVIAGPQHGTLTFDSDGGFLYRPEPGYNGSDAFQYKANDGNADSNVATVSVNVIPYSHAPQGSYRFISLEAPNSYTLKPADFGFTDPKDTPADAFTRVKIVALPTAGTLALDGVPVAADDFVSVEDIAAGKLVLSYAAGVPHPSFTFQVEDSGSTDNGGVNLDPEPKTLTFDFAAVAQDDSFSVDENAVLSVNAILGVLSNDSDVDGEQFITSIVVSPVHGSLQLQYDGSFVYTPDADFSGIDTFQYQASDGYVLSNVATVTITVDRVSQAPTGTSAALDIPANAPYALKVEDFGFSDPTDAPPDNFAGVLVSTLPPSGALKLGGVNIPAGAFISVADIAAGSFTFTPSVNAAGSPHASFTFQVEDSGSTEHGGTIVDPTPKTLAFNCIPVAQHDIYTVNVNTVLDQATSVLDNDTDADGDALTAVLVEAPQHGTLSLNGNGRFVYVPTNGFTGFDTFQYKANDGAAQSEPTTVTLHVAPPISSTISPIDVKSGFATNSPIRFLAAFSEPVIDFSPDDVILSGTAPGNLSVTVTPRPTNGPDVRYFEVVVTGMTGSGTVIAAIAADKVHNAAGLPNSASANTDNRVDYLYNAITSVGTSGNDVFEFFAGDTPDAWTLVINGQRAIFPTTIGTLGNPPMVSPISGILFDGNGGTDTFWFYGSRNALTANLGYEQGTIQFGSYTIAYQNMDYLSVAGASGSDTAALHDSAAADAFQGLSGQAQLTAPGKAITVKDFKSVAAHGGQGYDTAVMFGSPNGDSNCTAGPAGVNFIGSGFNYTAAGFKAVSAYPAPGKNNTAVFDSTSGADVLIASFLGAQYIGPGFAYDVWNVSSITGNGGVGDEARFYGSSGGNTVLNLSPTQALQTEAKYTLRGNNYSKFVSYVYPGSNTSATITGTAGVEHAVTSALGAQLTGTGLDLSAWTYKQINIVGAGGADTADMYAMAGANPFVGNGATATMTTGDVDRTITNFGTVTAHGNAASSATFFAKQGLTNTFNAGPMQASMSGIGYNIVATGFGSNTGYAVPGGTDVANYADSAGNDYFISSYLGSQMFGPGFSNAGWNFATKTATSTGGADTARFYGSPTSADSFVAQPGNSTQTTVGTVNEAKSFARVEAYSGLNTGGTAELTGSTGDDHYVGSPLGAQLWNANYRIEAWSYASIKAEGNGGNDLGDLYGSATSNALAADNVFAQFSGAGFNNRVDHFATTKIHGSATGSDSAMLDHALVEIGVKDQPTTALVPSIVRKLWLYDFDDVKTTEKPDHPDPQPQSIDKYMTAFMWEPLQLNLGTGGGTLTINPGGGVFTGGGTLTINPVGGTLVTGVNTTVTGSSTTVTGSGTLVIGGGTQITGSSVTVTEGSTLVVGH